MALSPKNFEEKDPQDTEPKMQWNISPYNNHQTMQQMYGYNPMLSQFKKRDMKDYMKSMANFRNDGVMMYHPYNSLNMQRPGNTFNMPNTTYPFIMQKHAH